MNTNARKSEKIINLFFLKQNCIVLNGSRMMSNPFYCTAQTVDNSSINEKCNDLDSESVVRFLVVAFKVDSLVTRALLAQLIFRLHNPIQY